MPKKEPKTPKPIPGDADLEALENMVVKCCRVDSGLEVKPHHIYFRFSEKNSTTAVIPEDYLELEGLNDAVFLVRINWDEWCSGGDKEALVHERLCACTWKVNEETGEEKPAVVKPIKVYPRNLAKHGSWNTELNQVKFAMEESGQLIIPIENNVVDIKKKAG